MPGVTTRAPSVATRPPNWQANNHEEVAGMSSISMSRGAIAGTAPIPAERARSLRR